MDVSRFDIMYKSEYRCEKKGDGSDHLQEIKMRDFHLVCSSTSINKNI